MPVLRAVALRRGAALDGGSEDVRAASQRYERWRATTADSPPSWEDLIRAADRVLGDREAPAVRYVGAAEQERLLHLDGVLASDLEPLAAWVASETGDAPSSPPQPLGAGTRVWVPGAEAAGAGGAAEAPPPAGTPPPSPRGGGVGTHIPVPEGLTQAQWEGLRAGVPGAATVEIPRHVRHRAGRLLTRLVRAASAGQGEVPRLAYVWALVTAGVVSPPEWRARLDLAEAGRVAELAERVLGTARTGGRSDRRRAARQLFSRGSLAKGVARLNARPAVAPTLEEVRRLYPPPFSGDGASPPEADGPVGGAVSSLRAAVVEAAEDDSAWRRAVVHRVCAGAVDAAAGPDGVRPSHLRQLLVLPGTGAELADAVADLVDVVCEGQAHPALYALRMAPVPKEGGGWRPVGVGSVFRRVAAALAADELHRGVAKELERDGQLGLSKGGPQRFLLRAQRAASAGLVVAKLDVANAYNTLSRQAGVAVARSLAGRSLGKVRAAAAAISNMYSDGEDVYVRADSGPAVVRCNRGVVQGCPGGSLVFNLAVRDLLLRVQGDLEGAGIAFRPLSPLSVPEVERGVGVVSYVALHDDVVLASQDQASLVAALEVFERALGAWAWLWGVSRSWLPAGRWRLGLLSALRGGLWAWRSVRGPRCGYLGGSVRRGLCSRAWLLACLTRCGPWWVLIRRMWFGCCGMRDPGRAWLMLLL